MRTVHTLLAVLLSLLIGSAHALTAPVVNVDRTVPSAVGITNGMVDFAPFATTAFSYAITNTGNMPLAIHAPTLSSVVGATVAITGVPASPVAAAGTATLTLSLTPTGSTGNWSFTVSFGNTDLTNNPFSWTVKNGTPQPDINVTYDQVNVIDDESATNTIEVGQADIIAIPYTIYPIVVSNTGSAPLRITAFSFPTGTGDQEGVRNIQLVPVPIFPLFIAPGSSRTFNIAVRALGGLSINWSAKVSIQNDDGTNLPTGGLPLGPERDYRFRIGSTYEAQTAFSGAYGKGEVRVLSSTGIICLNRGVARTAPGSSQVGVPSNQTLAIQNTSLVDTLRLIVPFVAAGPPRTFGDVVTVVPAGPTSPGPINATATITVQPITGLPFTDDVTKGYFELPVWPGPPAGFPTRTFTVQVTPLREGNWSVPVTFSNNDTDGEEPYTVTLTGFAVGVPDLAITNRGTTLVASGAIATGIVSAVGFTNLHSLVVTNTGTGTLLLDNTLISSAFSNCTPVGVPTTTATAIGPGGTATFSVRTTPTVLGAWSASYSLTSSDPTPSPITVTVSGNATTPAPEMDIFNGSTAVPNGGTATVKTSVFPGATAYTITMQNSGTGVLTVGPLPGAAVPSVGAVTNCTATISTPVTAPTTIAALDPSTSIPLIVNVTPTAEGPWTVVVTVVSDDADEGTYTFTLSGDAKKIKPQDQCGIGSGFSLMLLLLVGAVLPVVVRRR